MFCRVVLFLDTPAAALFLICEGQGVTINALNLRLSMYMDSRLGEEVNKNSSGSGFRVQNRLFPILAIISNEVNIRRLKKPATNKQTT